VAAPVNAATVAPSIRELCWWQFLVGCPWCDSLPSAVVAAFAAVSFAADEPLIVGTPASPRRGLGGPDSAATLHS